MRPSTGRSGRGTNSFADRDGVRPARFIEADVERVDGGHVVPLCGLKRKILEALQIIRRLCGRGTVECRKPAAVRSQINDRARA
jgi:hypothetical protein